MPDQSIAPLKRCRKCGVEYPATPEFFNRHKFPNGTNGFRAQCKTCYAAAKRAYQKANPQKIRTYQGAWAKANPQLMRAKDRRYRLAHPERVVEKRRAYEKANPGYFRIKTQKRMARKLSLPDTLARGDWQRCLDYWHDCCAVCGRQQGFWRIIAADHWIPLDDRNCPGTVAANIVPLCQGVNGCNNSKGKREAIGWLRDKFGPRKAKQIAARIEAYFQSLEVK